MGSWAQALAIGAGGVGDLTAGLMTGISSIINADQNRKFLAAQTEYLRAQTAIQQQSLELAKQNQPLQLYQNALAAGFTHSGAFSLAGSAHTHSFQGHVMAPMKVSELDGIRNAHTALTMGSMVHTAASGGVGRPAPPRALVPVRGATSSFSSV